MAVNEPSNSPRPADKNARAGKPSARRDAWLGGVLVLLAFGLLVEAKLWRPDALFSISANVQIAEAQAWWQGRPDLPEREWDTAVKDGRFYSCFPPMFSFIAAGVVPFFHGLPHWFVMVVLVLPVPLLAYVLFLRRTGSPVWGVVLAVGFVCGTSLFPVLDKTLRGASPYSVNHALATIGLLIVLIESFGRRRVLVAGIGLIIAALSRQLTVAYVIPIAWMAAYGFAGRERLRRVAVVAGAGAIIVTVHFTMNTLKFGHPLDTGYMHIYEDRSDDWARDAQTYGLFSAHFVPRNLYHMNLGFPKMHRIEMAGKPKIYLRPNMIGTGIWWTTPLLLWLFVDIRRILADRTGRVWLLAAAIVALVLLFYHGTGAVQRGFNRFSLDYVPVLLALVAPRCAVGWRRWAGVVMIGWSVLYFRWLI